MKGRIFLFGVSLVLLMSCYNFSAKKVVITRKYIINPNWSKNLLDNHITIYRLQLADSSRPIIVDSIFRSRDPEYDPFKTFVRDTCTWFTAFNIPYNGTSFRKRKIYFDRPNGFKWLVHSCDSLDSTYHKFWWWHVSPGFFDRPRNDSIDGRRRPQGFYTERDTIGALELNSWYAFGGLTRWGHIYFVYVDSTGGTWWLGTLPPWFKPI
jgi:hypothetical protein